MPAWAKVPCWNQAFQALLVITVWVPFSHYFPYFIACICEPPFHVLYLKGMPYLEMFSGYEILDKKSLVLFQHNLWTWNYYAQNLGPFIYKYINYTKCLSVHNANLDFSFSSVRYGKIHLWCNVTILRIKIPSTTTGIKLHMLSRWPVIVSWIVVSRGVPLNCSEWSSSLHIFCKVGMLFTPYRCRSFTVVRIINGPLSSLGPREPDCMQPSTYYRHMDPHQLPCSHIGLLIAVPSFKRPKNITRYRPSPGPSAITDKCAAWTHPTPRSLTGPKTTPKEKPACSQRKYPAAALLQYWHGVSSSFVSC